MEMYQLVSYLNLTRGQLHNMLSQYLNCIHTVETTMVPMIDTQVNLLQAVSWYYMPIMHGCYSQIICDCNNLENTTVVSPKLVKLRNMLVTISTKLVVLCLYTKGLTTPQISLRLSSETSMYIHLCS